MVKLEFTKIEKLNAEIDDQIIEDLLHPGIAMLYGKEKSYKSMFATSISKCISDVLIQVFIRRSIKRHGKVIYFALDDRGRTIMQRFSGLENILIMDWKDYNNNCSILKDEMKMQNYIPKDGTAMFTHLLSNLVETHDIEPVLVVVDTWEKIRSAGHQSYYGEEVTDYFGIGEKKMRNMATYLDGIFVKNGNKTLVIREKLEEYLKNNDSI